MSYTRCAQGISPDICACLPDWRFEDCHFFISPDHPSQPTLPRSHHHTALHNVSMQLSTLLACCDESTVPTIQFGYWQWSDEAVRDVSAFSSSHPHHQISFCEVNLSDELLDAVIAMRPRVGEVNLFEITHCERHVGGEWQFEAMETFEGGLNTVHMAMLPRPVAPCTISTGDVYIQDNVLEVRGMHDEKCVLHLVLDT